MAPLPQRLTGDEAKQKLAAMGGIIMFEKVLTSSDVNGTGRLVIPKSQAEAHFPRLEEQTGMALALTDTEGKKHNFRFRFWVNNQSRMYLLEQTAAVQAKYRMQAGDVLVFAKLPDGQYAICGRKGTKDDVSRKPPVRRTASQQAAAAGGAAADGSPAGGEAQPGSKRPRARGSKDTLKNKRMKQKAATQEIQSLLSYWSGCSLPMRKDGVFRTVPNSAAQEGDRVVAQYGAWSAIVSIGGELFQAFFDTHEAANAALEAALQSKEVLPPRKEADAAAAARRAGAAAAGEPTPAASAPAAAGGGAPVEVPNTAAGSGLTGEAKEGGQMEQMQAQRQGRLEQAAKQEQEEEQAPPLQPQPAVPARAVAVQPVAG